MATWKPLGHAHKTGHKAEGWEEEWSLREGPTAWVGAGGFSLGHLAIHLVGNQAGVLSLPWVFSLLSLSPLLYEWKK